MEIPHNKENTYSQLVSIITENKKWGVNILLSKNAVSSLMQGKSYTTLASEGNETFFVRSEDNDFQIKEKISLIRISDYLFALKKITLNNEIIYDVQNTKRPKTIMIS